MAGDYIPQTHEATITDNTTVRRILVTHNMKTCIIPRHMVLAIRNTEEVGRLLDGVTGAHGGVLHRRE